MKNDKLQDAYEDWADEWKPCQGENHPNSYDAFEAGWMAAIEVMLDRLELVRQ